MGDELHSTLRALTQPPHILFKYGLLKAIVSMLWCYNGAQAPRLSLPTVFFHVLILTFPVSLSSAHSPTTATVPTLNF